MQESRLAQTATLEQQQEIARYMSGLNSWLERDVSSRQEEIRAVSARVDQLRDLLLHLMNREGARDGIRDGATDDGREGEFHRSTSLLKS